MHAEFQALIELPTAENFRQVRELVLAQSSYDPLGLELAALEQAGHRRAWRKASNLASEMMERWLLSPRFHYWVALAADALGDEADAELERFLFGACLDALASTGDGSRERPYLVTHLADVYDLLAWRGLDPESQSLVRRGDRHCDLVQTKEGLQVWFDVTEVLAHSAVPSGDLLARHASGALAKMPRFRRDFWSR